VQKEQEQRRREKRRAEQEEGLADESSDDENETGGSNSGNSGDNSDGRQIDGHFPGLASALLGDGAFDGGEGFKQVLESDTRLGKEIADAVDTAQDRLQAALTRVSSARPEMQRRMQAVLESAGKESRHGVYARLGNPDQAPPSGRASRTQAAAAAPTGSSTTTNQRRAARQRTPKPQPGDAQILARRANALEVMNALTHKRDAQKEIAGEIEQAEQQALILDALDVTAPTTTPSQKGANDAQWHDMAHAEKLKAFAAADWLIHSCEITRRQIDALPTNNQSLGADAFQTMMCATIGGMLPMFAGKEGKPIRVLKATAGAAVVRTDKALDKPLDARATNLLSVDTGNGTGSFSDRHDGLRNRIYEEARYAGCAVDREVELGTEHGLAQELVDRIRNEATRATGRTGTDRREDLAQACLKMRLDLTCQFQSDDSKLVGEFKSVSWCKSHVQRSGKRNGGAGADPKTRPFMTTPDAIANAARIDRGDKADEIDEALNHGRPVIRDAMAKQGVMTGIAVGGCCDLSTSAHHLIDKIGTEQGYLMAESTGMDIDDAISIATRLLKGRIARQVWRDYHKHAFARRCYADPSDANLAEQHRARKQHEDERTEREELALARTFLAWRRGMG